MLSESLSTVKIQVQQMKRHLVSFANFRHFLAVLIDELHEIVFSFAVKELDQLMDALKSASLMLAELRTSSLSPKQYYELCASLISLTAFLLFSLSALLQISLYLMLFVTYPTIYMTLIPKVATISPTCMSLYNTLATLSPVSIS